MPIINSEIDADVVFFYPDLVNIYGARIKAGTSVGPFVEIQDGVTIGSNCKISSHSFICSGVSIGDGVFIGHGVMTTNDRYPRATNAAGTKATRGDWKLERIEIGDRASVGSGVTILPGVSLGADCVIGAGSVVTRDVAPGACVYGNPASVKGGK